MKQRYRCKCCNKIRDLKIDKKSSKFCNSCFDAKVEDAQEENANIGKTLEEIKRSLS